MKLGCHGCDILRGCDDWERCVGEVAGERHEELGVGDAGAEEPEQAEQ